MTLLRVAWSNFCTAAFRSSNGNRLINTQVLYTIVERVIYPHVTRGIHEKKILHGNCNLHFSDFEQIPARTGILCFKCTFYSLLLIYLII